MPGMCGRRTRWAGAARPFTVVAFVAALAFFGFLSAQAFGGTARLMEATTGDPGTSTVATTVPKPDPPPLPKPPVHTVKHRPAPRPPVRSYVRVTPPAPRVVHVAPPPPAPPPPAPVIAPPPAPVLAPHVVHRPAHKARHAVPAAETRRTAPPAARPLPETLALGAALPAAPAVTQFAESDVSRTARLLGVAMLAGAMLLSGAALVPGRRLPVGVARTVGGHRLELVLGSLVLDVAFAVVFLYLLGV